MEPIDPKTKTQPLNDPTSTAKTVQLDAGDAGEKHPLTGQVLGTYEVQDVIGKGGMGVVFRARDTALDRAVALKILAPELAGDEGYVERFLREAKAAAKLDHPNVVQVYAAGRTQSLCWMAMQYAKGVPLSSHLRNGRKFTVTESLQVVRQVALALGAAHKAGIIHRDIKPSNIMLDETDRALVMDFGLSRGIATGELITRTGTYLGTPEYSSPEQCETNDLDGRSDIYSLGVVLYEMLTGRVPHVAETPLALFKKIAEECPTPVTAINKEVPASVQTLLDRMIAKDRDQRYASAEEVVRDIDKVLKGQSLLAAASPATPRRLGWIAAAAAVLVIVGVAAWKWPSSMPSGPTSPVDDGSSKVIPEPVGTAVVVLDFRNLTGNKETAWMEIGLPELLLGQLDGLLAGNVVPREELLETMGKVVGKKVNVEESGARLALGKDLSEVLGRVNGRVVVTGTYAVSGSEIRVTAYLYERRAGAELARLDMCMESGPVDDVFGLVDRLAQSIASRVARCIAPQPSMPQVPPAAPAPMKADQKEVEKPKPRLHQMQVSSALRQTLLKTGEKIAGGGWVARLWGMFDSKRRNQEELGKGEAPPQPSPDPGRNDGAHAEPEEGRALLSDGKRGALAGDDEFLARMKRFFENLRTCEEMDLRQQKALRNDEAFLESLCEEGCADTIKEKYQSWCERNQSPQQEGELAK